MVNLFALLEEAIAITNRDPRPYHVPLSMSKGFATYYAGETYNEVFKRADHMMYGAKQAYYQRMGIGRGNEPVSRNAD
jgi:GGDEF domain-containing protein